MNTPLSDFETLCMSIERFFSLVDTRTNAFVKETGIRCPAGCGRCCRYPRIMVGVAEWIPLARHLWDTDRAERVYRTISTDMNICMFFAETELPGGGHCSVYAHRGLLCRTFGFLSARQIGRAHV